MSAATTANFIRQSIHRQAPAQLFRNSTGRLIISRKRLRQSRYKTRQQKRLSWMTWVTANSRIAIQKLLSGRRMRKWFEFSLRTRKTPKWSHRPRHTSVAASNYLCIWRRNTAEYPALGHLPHLSDWLENTL